MCANVPPVHPVHLDRTAEPSLPPRAPCAGGFALGCLNLVSLEAASLVGRTAMTAGVTAPLLSDSSKPNRFRSVGGSEGGRKPRRSASPEAVKLLSEALLDVSRELAQLRQVCIASCFARLGPRPATYMPCCPRAVRRPS